MTAGPLVFAPFDAGAVRVLLCDADDCLFASEGLAFAASAAVVERMLGELGVPVSLDPEAFRREAAGRNFRANATGLAAAHGLKLEPEVLERWVAEERREVSAALAAALRPDDGVKAPLAGLAQRLQLAAVSSSALARLDVCFRASDLHDLFPPEARFSAEDSLPEPTSKPDPAIYRLAGERLGVAGEAALAVEDSSTGARSAVAAGFPCVGNVLFVAPEEREERVEALRAAGVAAVVSSWEQLAALLDGAA